jgi:hypothetical protein
MENDCFEGVGLRGAVRAAARWLVLRGAVFFLVPEEDLRVVPADRTLLEAFFGAIFLVFGFALALVAIFPPTAAKVYAIIALMFLADFGPASKLTGVCL